MVTLPCAVLKLSFEHRTFILMRQIHQIWTVRKLFDGTSRVMRLILPWYDVMKWLFSRLTSQTWRYADNIYRVNLIILQKNWQLLSTELPYVIKRHIWHHIESVKSLRAVLCVAKCRPRTGHPVQGTSLHLLGRFAPNFCTHIKGRVCDKWAQALKFTYRPVPWKRTSWIIESE